MRAKASGPLKSKIYFSFPFHTEKTGMRDDLYCESLPTRFGSQSQKKNYKNGTISHEKQFSQKLNCSVAITSEEPFGTIVRKFGSRGAPVRVSAGHAVIALVR